MQGCDGAGQLPSYHDIVDDFSLFQTSPHPCVPEVCAGFTASLRPPPPTPPACTFVKAACTFARPAAAAVPDMALLLRC